MLMMSPMGVSFDPGEKMKTMLMMLMATLLLSACNTMAGMGEDVSAAGKGVSNAADDVKEKM